jgi:chromosome segregation ATPase
MSAAYTPDQIEDDEDERNANAQLISDLKEQVQRAEQASEQYRKTIEQLQNRLDEATNEQTNAEERDFQRQTELDKLRAEVKELSRQKREAESSHESEKRMLLQERESLLGKDAQSQTIIARLNETLRDKGLEMSHANRACECLHTGHYRV